MKRSINRFKNMNAKAYAEYVAGTHVAGRDPFFKDDASKSYGYEPIDFICAVMKDGTIQNKMLEFKQINHCLKFEGRDAAVDAVQCILLEWAAEDRNVVSFDVEKIKKSTELLELNYRKRLHNEEAAKLEAEKQKTETKQKENENGRSTEQ